MLLLTGLGNPGPRHAADRHNIGFMALDAVARAHAAAPWRRRFQGQAAEVTLGGVRALLLKPETYMNESGRAVAEAVRFYKLAPADVTALHDELDLAPGRLRVKLGGGDAGHNGLRSITAAITPAYRRVRLGIGHPGHKDAVHGHVLSPFAKAEAPWVEDLCGAVAEFAPLLAAGEDGHFQSKVALAMEARGHAEPAKAGVARKPADDKGD